MSDALANQRLRDQIMGDVRRLINSTIQPQQPAAPDLSRVTKEDLQNLHHSLNEEIDNLVKENQRLKKECESLRDEIQKVRDLIVVKPAPPATSNLKAASLFSNDPNVTTVTSITTTPSVSVTTADDSSSAHPLKIHN